jgi:hypothetical protein
VVAADAAVHKNIAQTGLCPARAGDLAQPTRLSVVAVFCAAHLAREIDESHLYRARLCARKLNPPKHVAGRQSAHQASHVSLFAETELRHFNWRNNGAQVNNRAKMAQLEQ